MRRRILLVTPLIWPWFQLIIAAVRGEEAV